MIGLKHKTVIAILVLIAILLIGNLRLSILSIAKAPLSFIHSLPHQIKELSEYRILRNENEKLKSTIDLLTDQITGLKEASNENVRLRGLLSFKQASPHRMIAAGVVGKSGSAIENSILIDKGTLDGIMPDMPVITPKGLVGRVAKAGYGVAWVILLTDANFRASCLTTRARELGVVQGLSTGRCSMKYLSLDSDVAAGDEVVTAGFGKVFPKGLPVGRIIKVNASSDRFFNSALIEVEADLRHLEEVLVIVDKK